MAWHERFRVPTPFHYLDVFSLLEPASETDTEIVFVHRLYMVSPFAEGGRVLLRQAPAHTFRKDQLELGKAMVN